MKVFTARCTTIRLRLASVIAAVIVAGVGVSTLAYSQEDAVLAIINDFELRASDVNSQISTMPLGDQVTIRSNPEKFVESLIQEEVLFQFAIQHELGSSQALRDQLKEIAVNHLIDKYVTQELVVTDAEIETYYENNTGAIRGETVQVSHILTETRDECDAILLRLQQGESFTELASQYSIHERSAVNGGELGSIMNHDGPLGFEQELFEIPQNQHTIFESDEGCHVVLITGSETPPLPPIENVAPALENLLKREKEIEALTKLFERAHDKIEVIRPSITPGE